MPEKEHRFSIRAAPQDVGALLGDFSRVQELFPPFSSSEGAEGGFRWQLKGPLKAKAGTPFLQAEIIDKKPGHIAWKADAPHLHWSGRFDWRGEGNDSEVTIKLHISDTGPLGKVHEAMISLQINNIVKYFEQQVRKKLEKQP